MQILNLTTEESCTGRLAITGTYQIYLPVEVQQILKGAGRIRLVIAMTNAATRIPISDIILDEEIYLRDGVDQRRVGIFAENIRDGFMFDPIEVQTHPDLTGKYRILDGVHKWSAYKATGTAEPEVIIKI